MLSSMVVGNSNDTIEEKIMNYYLHKGATIEAAELFDYLTGGIFREEDEERKEGIERILDKFDNYYEAGRDDAYQDTIDV